MRAGPESTSRASGKPFKPMTVTSGSGTMGGCGIHRSLEAASAHGAHDALKQIHTAQPAFFETLLSSRQMLGGGCMHACMLGMMLSCAWEGLIIRRAVARSQSA